ncbi:hypothetical protein NDU88_005730 [Pleurodeles waltl]|uniref:Uncharacterized protein n=1 Tax=Pleurodeles waltl TaxID=8319 RepID=A0AAV7SMR5_PLEWA|nr:hypothetical protein NDU88_005730 [Pleurodeles waltl]
MAGRSGGRRRHWRDARLRVGTGPPPREPLLSEIMAAIHDLKGSLEPRLGAVTIDVGLLQADLQKVSDKVSTAETDIVRLQSTSKALEEQHGAGAGILKASGLQCSPESAHWREPIHTACMTGLRFASDNLISSL